MKNFGQYAPGRVTILDNIYTTAKGYEALVESKLRKVGVVVWRNTYVTTLRLHMEESADRAAWEHLQRRNRGKYHSVN